MIWTIIIGLALTTLALVVPLLLPQTVLFAPSPLLTAIVGVAGTGFVAGWQVALRRLQNSVRKQEIQR